MSPKVIARRIRRRDKRDQERPDVPGVASKAPLITSSIPGPTPPPLLPDGSVVSEHRESEAAADPQPHATPSQPPESHPAEV
jgi:hypothetical protein